MRLNGRIEKLRSISGIADLQTKLKTAGFNWEEITDFAEEAVWEEDEEAGTPTADVEARKSKVKDLSAVLGILLLLCVNTIKADLKKQSWSGIIATYEIVELVEEIVEMLSGDVALEFEEKSNSSVQKENSNPHKEPENSDLPEILEL